MEKKKKKKNKTKWIFLIILLLLIIYMTFFDDSSFIRKSKILRENKRLKDEIITLEKENKRLNSENEALKTDRKLWEEKAREYGMQKKGEEVFIFKPEIQSKENEKVNK
jgi:cell division protein FtsB